jgi:predicted DNA-binding protein
MLKDRRAFVFRLSEPLQQKITQFLTQTNRSMANLIDEAMDRAFDKYSKYLTNETGANAIWKRKATVIRLGSSIDKEMYTRMLKISELTGRSVADLIKEAIWEIINEEEGKDV